MATKGQRVLWGICGLSVAVVPALLYAYASGPDPRATGAPGDVNAYPMACASSGCHFGTPLNSAGGKVAATFSGGSSYTPGVAQTITVTVSDPVNTHYGFQMTARLESNLANGQAGDFTSGPGTFVLCDNNQPKPKSGCGAMVQFIEHTTPSTPSWTFTWTPPAANAGNIHFYVAGNAVNFNGEADKGDHAYTNSYVLTPAAGCTLSPPSITNVISAGAYGAFTTFGGGSWIEVYGSNLAANTREWTGNDFSGVNAPTKLDGAAVSINGQSAFTWYISQGQMNVQAPADTATGPVQITATNCAGASAPFVMQRAAMMPGMLAPPSFVVGGKQYLAALYSDGITFVGNTNLIPGVPFRPAKPGDSITAYGIGFGDVMPPIPPGVIVTQSNSIPNLTIQFGQTPAATTYAGLAPGFVGLYQFNITVPDVADGDYQIHVALGGVAVQQTMFLTVHR